MGSYGPNGDIHGLPPATHQYQLLELESLFYGAEPNLQVGVFPSLLGTFVRTPSSPGRPAKTVDSVGMNDLTFGMKYRWVVQNPATLRPSIATVVLPTFPAAQWTGNEVPKGLLPPLSVVAAARGGSPALNLGALMRKNIQPFRFYADFYYGYAFPLGSAQYGDLLQERLAVEDVFDDQTGLGVIVEFVGLDGMPFSIDGHAVTAGPRHFNIFGVQPSVEFNLTPSIAGSFGVLMPVSGSNELLSIAPSVSLWWYWNRGKAIIPR